jgi:hypothetical protein
LRDPSPKNTWQHQSGHLISISCDGLIDGDVVSREGGGSLRGGALILEVLSLIEPRLAKPRITVTVQRELHGNRTAI